MGSRPIVPMPISERAKQFMPFSALTGLENALRRREKIIQNRIILPDEAERELDKKLHQIQTGRIVDVRYYDGAEYIVVSGCVDFIDKVKRILYVGSVGVPFDDIIDVDGKYDTELWKNESL